jgi:tRNA threonylcarbamoyladenosine modification (KEOPS) complex  Pcc1 subunit
MSSTKRVFVTRRLPAAAMRLLEARTDIELRVNARDEPLTRAELEEAFRWVGQGGAVLTQVLY